MEDTAKIEEVVKEVVENVPEIASAPAVKDAGVSLGKVVGVAAVTYSLFEGGKWLISKIRNAAKKRKADKESCNEDVMNAHLVIDPEDE